VHSESGSGHISVPRTWIGRWLLAVILRQPDGDVLQRQINDGRPGWNHDEPAVVEAASELAARLLFDCSFDVRDVTKLASSLHDSQKAQAPPGVLEIEAIVRYALGESYLLVNDISPSVLLKVRTWIIAWAFLELGMGVADLEKLVRHAEQQAIERGFRPASAERSQ
jgi:hypothetical protein